LKAIITTYSTPKGTAPNEDAGGAELWNDAIIAVIADGVGRAELADEAARRIVSSTIQNFKARPRTWSLHKALEEFARLSNRTLYHDSHSRFERPELVSTLAVVAIEGNRLVGLNVGDSRVYRFRNGTLSQLSTDHTVDNAEMGHVLTQAIGLQPEIAPCFFEHIIEAGDAVLLCTDGVTKQLPDDALAQLLHRSATARVIVQAAVDRSSPETADDATAVVLRIQDTSHPGHVQLKVPDTLRAGQVIDGYELLASFGSNERTWTAQRGSEKVVMKFAPREARADEAIRNQFVKEIWSLTRLQDEHFIRAFTPAENTTLCYCMEYLEAPNLKVFLRGGTFSTDHAAALLRFLLDAAQYLLRFDLVHGDLKPENILVLKRGDVLSFKLIDFGSINEIFTVTSRAGTPSYLAPERFHGAACSERTEIFALGVILYQVLTGSFPYGEVEPFQTPAFGTPRRLTKLNPNVPPWLEAVALRAVAVKPEHRYQSFSEMKFDLDHPASVRPFFDSSVPLLERDPALFYKIAFALSAALNLFLLLRWLRER
jgi:serine/threonine protein phosphatase PrpC